MSSTSDYREIIVQAQKELRETVLNHLDADLEILPLKNLLNRFATLLGRAECFLKRCTIHFDDGKSSRSCWKLGVISSGS